MQNIIFTLLGAGLLVVAVLLVRRQLQLWESLGQAHKPKKISLETRFETSQCRRRIQCSMMLAILAVGMIIEIWVSNTIVRVVLGAAMLIILGWMILLAMLDVLATISHYRRMSNRNQSEQIRLKSKVKQILHSEGEDNSE